MLTTTTSFIVQGLGVKTDLKAGRPEGVVFKTATANSPKLKMRKAFAEFKFLSEINPLMKIIT